MKRFALGLVLLAAAAPADDGLSFHPITPCRWIDTRENLCEVGSYIDDYTPCPTGALRDGETRRYNAQESPVCPDGERPVPIGAKVLVFTATAVEATGQGRLVFHDATTARPNVSSLNFAPGLARSNLVFMRLGQLQGQDLETLFYPDTAVWAHVEGGGTVHVVLDVLGYFR